MLRAIANPYANRPYTTVVLAMSADGKIADEQRSAARFSSPTDLAHLQKQVALADAVLFGAATLRAYGTTLSVSHPPLIQQRQQLGLPPQPIQIVCSKNADIDPNLRFFQQQVPRWLLTTAIGANHWQGQAGFAKILMTEVTEHGINWLAAFQQLKNLGLERLAVLGGGNLVASLLANNLIDELWLTVCPLILGGEKSPTPVEGRGFLPNLAPRLELLSVEAINQEVFLHYRVQHF